MKQPLHQGLEGHAADVHSRAVAPFEGITSWLSKSRLAELLG
jgi:hypothetical protein